MAKPRTVTWPAKEHTLAKHKILRAYLEAWIPIMSKGCAPHGLMSSGPQ